MNTVEKETLKTSEPAIVIGHKAPDTDSAVSAVAAAYLLNQRGIPAEPFVQGELNPETKFLFKTFNQEAPAVVGSIKGRDVYLVDFSDMTQAPEEARTDKTWRLKGIFDHHKLGDATSDAPLEVWIMPLGCCNTVIKQAFDFYQIPVTKELAALMLGAILSDTLVFESPTTTEKDKQVAAELAALAGVEDMKALGEEMLKAQSGLDEPPARLLTRDFKDFNMNGKKVGVAGLTLLTIDQVSDELRQNLKAEMENMVKAGRDVMVLMMVDLKNKGCEFMVVGDKPEEVLKALGADEKNWAPGVMSRKSQVVPPLQKYFS